ncbi:MAG: FAD/NAD(P)-binding protein [Nitrosomonas sp.]|nr:FAD/NAD(P)-binding protein [Nitrosomonas sp.]
MSLQALLNNPMEPTPFRILSVKRELHDCFTLTLACEQIPFHFAPGQFNMLYVFGHGEVPISMSGNPNQSDLLVHTIRNVGSVTAALQQLREGDFVGIRGPFGNSWPLSEAKGKDIIMLAGGLGLAPLRPAIYHILENQTHYKNTTLCYGARNPEAILFFDELEQWAHRITVELTVDSAGPGWSGHVGVITDRLQQQAIALTNTIAFVCGPEIMMRYSAYALIDNGLSADRIYISMERNMKCAVGLCGRCQFGPYFICQDGPVFSFDKVERLLKIREA